MRRIFYVISALIFVGAVSPFFTKDSLAAQCPSGADDCFMCGDTPCTHDCVGVWDEASQQNVSCKCPQGEECTCYCQYGQESDGDTEDKSGSTETEVSVDDQITDGVYEEYPDEGTSVVKVVGSPKLLKNDSGLEQTLTSSSSIEAGDRLMVGQGEMAMVSFGDFGSTFVFGNSDVVIVPTDDGVAFDGVADIWMVTKHIYRLTSGFGYVDEAGNEINVYTDCNIMGQDIMINQLEQDASSVCKVRYNVRSEIQLSIDDESQSLRVIEGSVVAKNLSGEMIEIKSGERVEIDDSSDFSSYEVEEFDLSDLDTWWTDDFDGVVCPNTCDDDQDQSPFPGCSCIDGNSETDDEDEKLGGLYSPLVMCACGVGCMFVFVILVVIIVVVVKKKGKSSEVSKR